MIQVVKYKAEHSKRIAGLKRYDAFRDIFTDEFFVKLEENPSVSTILVDGEAILFGGATEFRPGRAEVWAFTHPDCSKHFLAVHRIVKSYLSMLPIRRLEAAVECSFEKGRRWVAALGFKLEAERMEAFLPDGKDCALYARVKHV